MIGSTVQQRCELYPSVDLGHVTVVMPVLNEELHLAEALDALENQIYPSDLLEIVVVDGGSVDKSPEIASARAMIDPRISFLSRPGFNCPTSMNEGVKAARGRYICKLDGHGFASPSYLEIGAEFLDRNPEVGCVGGSIVPLWDGAIQQSNAIARFSLFGVGRGAYTRRAEIRSVDTVQCGVYRRQALMDAGYFDGELQFGEDEEFNYRVRRAGWQVVHHPGMQYYYSGRATFGAIFRQYYRYGNARAKVLAKHPGFLSPKHLVPSFATASLAVGALSPLITANRWFLAPGAAYLAFLLLASTILSVCRRFRFPHLIAISLICIHLGYGAGLLKGGLQIACGSKNPRRPEAVDELSLAVVRDRREVPISEIRQVSTEVVPHS